MSQKHAFVCNHDPSAPTRELIDQLHQARFDHEAFVAFFREDCRFGIVGQVPQYPFSAIYVGKSGVRALLRRIDDQVELTEARILNLLVDGERVAVRGSVVVRHHGAAARLRLMMGNLIQFRDGKVLEMSEYYRHRLAAGTRRRVLPRAGVRKRGRVHARETVAALAHMRAFPARLRGHIGISRMCQKEAFAFDDHPFAATRDLVIHAHRKRCDLPAFLAYFQDDCAFRIVGRVPDYPFSGLYVGKAGVGALLRRIDDQIEQTEDSILNLLVDGDQVAVRRSVVVRHYGTAARTRLVVGDIFTLRDGKVAEISEYVDTAWLRKLTGDET